MIKIVSFIKIHKIPVIVASLIIIFLLLRTILLQKPNTEITYTVKRENLVDTVQVSGTYTTASQTQVMSPTNGAITQLFVQNGETVKKGDKLFHVESTATPDQQKTANANYLAASSTVQADQATLYSLQSIMYKNWDTFFQLATNSTYQNSDDSPNTTNRVLPAFTTAQDNWLAAEANYKNQQSVIAKDQAALAAAKQAYDETQSVTVTAPISGNIVNLLSQTGDQVTAVTTTNSEITQNPDPVLVIANLANPYISADISEDYATRIQSGQKVSIVFDAVKDQTFSGIVGSIATVGINNSGVVTYPMRIVTENLSEHIKPNMTAILTIETLRKNNVIDVPNSAVITDHGVSYVIQAGSHKHIPIIVGTKGVSKTEITNGLSEGIVIVATSQVD